MVYTRSQYYKLTADITGESLNASTDSEVSFGPGWLDRAILGRRLPPVTDTDTGSEHHSATDMSEGDDRHERRMLLLESAVLGMNEKFDALLISVNSSNPDTCGLHRRDLPGGPGQHGFTSPPGHNQHGGDDGGRHSQSRPANIDPRAPQYSDFVAEQLRREDFHIPRSDEGKALYPDLYVQRLIPEPYMYMLRDPRVDKRDISIDAQLEHLQQVIQDAATRDWPSVRRWSQATFDAVENGSCGWEDRHDIQIQRLHHAIVATRQTSNQAPAGERRDLPCRDFNSIGGCPHPRSHQGRNVTFVHLCSSCFSTGERAPHTAPHCPRRAQHNTRGHQLSLAQTVAQSKNAQLASQPPARLVRPAQPDQLFQ